MTDLITFDTDGDVAVIGLNRPEKRNALSEATVDELEAAVARAAAGCRAAVIFGHGKHFCAGLDLAEHAERSLHDGMHNSRRWHAVFDRIQRGSIPYFCALHGAVAGGGLELAAATHVRIADEGAFFALPEGQRGIFVGGGGSVRVARLTGAARMTDMMLTGRVLGTAVAELWGIVQYRTPAGESLDKAKSLAARAATNSSLTNFAIINALPRIQDMSHEDGLFVESLMAAITSASEDARDRLRDFLEGRAEPLKPDGNDGV